MMPVLVALIVFCAALLLLWWNGPPESEAHERLRFLKGQLSKARPGEAQVGSGLRLGALSIRPDRLMIVTLVGSLLLGALAFRISGNLPIGLALFAFGIGWSALKVRQQQAKRREELAVQFKEAINSIAFSLKAGSSLHTAIEQALSDLKRIFAAEPDAPVLAEFDSLVHQLRLGVPVDLVLKEWATRLQLEEITDFVSATLAVKSRGGNLAEVMSTISETISWKIVAQAQIRALTAEKRSEANILTATPMVILVMLALLSPAYISPLFHSDGGQIILLIGLVCNGLAFFAVRKVLESPL